MTVFPPKITGPERFDRFDFCDVCECLDLLSSLDLYRDESGFLNYENCFFVLELERLSSSFRDFELSLCMFDIIIDFSYKFYI